MKIFTWNVNGIRSVFRTTFRDWLAAEDPDIVCLQEIKADSVALTPEFTQIDGYYAYFNSAEKKGYSGVAVYTKIKPLSVETELGFDRFDHEGRMLKLVFPDFTLFNFYIPHGGRFKENLAYKLEAYRKIFKAVGPLGTGKAFLAGDFNIAHTELDLYFPKANENNIMFTPEERKQIDALLAFGYADSFRSLHPDTKAYTWWPYRNDLRERDIGWRIDYIFASAVLAPLVREASTHREVLGSDHGPYGIMLDMPMPEGERPTYSAAKPVASLF